MIFLPSHWWNLPLKWVCPPIKKHAKCSTFQENLVVFFAFCAHVLLFGTLILCPWILSDLFINSSCVQTIRFYCIKQVCHQCLLLLVYKKVGGEHQFYSFNLPVSELFYDIHIFSILYLDVGICCGFILFVCSGLLYLSLVSCNGERIFWKWRDCTNPQRQICICKSWSRGKAWCG